jgi:hypothetical protein
LTTKISSSSLPSEISSLSSEEEQSNKKERRFRRTKQKMEYELTEIYRRLCNGETDLQIMTNLHLQERNYYKYKKRLEARIMEYQLKKTDDTIFTECQFFKSRMLTLYKALENQVTSDKTSGTDKAKCAEVASEIAIDLLKLESENVKAIHEIISKTTYKNNNNNNNDGYIKEYDPNRKF